MRKLLGTSVLLALTAAFSGCKSKPAPEAKTAAAPVLGIRPHGDETIDIDTSKLPPELQKTFAYIDSHIDEHVLNLQKWVQQPSISNSGEGIPESAEMVKGFYDKFGCQQTKIYDVGITEYGTPGNPVVYAKCDFGAPKTLIFYWMYDTMPVTQPDMWIAPPFEGRIVSGATAQVPNAAKVMIARGAVNTKGSEMAALNGLTALKDSMGGKLPVNIIFIAEGDEERMSIGLRTFFRTHSDLFDGADALYAGGPSEGCVYVELTTSGTKWGRGPTVSDIHGVFKRAADSPAWRHIHMLGSLTSNDGNTPLIKGFFDNIEPMTPIQEAGLKMAASHVDLASFAKSVGLARFMSDDPYTVLKDFQYGTSFNLDGIWGGNMYAGGAGAILPNKITSKHNFRYVPKMNGLDIVKKLRAQLDANGYQDVEVRLVGDIPWSKGSEMKSDINTAHGQALKMLGLNQLDAMAMFMGTQPEEEKKKPATPPGSASASLQPSSAGAFTPTGGYWPSYLFADGEVGEKIGHLSVPMGASFGFAAGGRAHAANEYFVIEGKGKTPGIATDEKYVAAAVFSYANDNTTPPRPKPSTPK
jgi:acetylornithine deacetylase/succinyl-diaminopimelate desuccinylase-like protein